MKVYVKLTGSSCRLQLGGRVVGSIDQVEVKDGGSGRRSRRQCDDEDSNGSSITKVAPSPGVLTTEISPP